MLSDRSREGDQALGTPRDRSMLALQYAIAITAGVAAVLLAVLR